MSSASPKPLAAIRAAARGAAVSATDCGVAVPRRRPQRRISDGFNGNGRHELNFEASGGAVAQKYGLERIPSRSARPRPDRRSTPCRRGYAQGADCSCGTGQPHLGEGRRPGIAAGRSVRGPNLPICSGSVRGGICIESELSYRFCMISITDLYGSSV